MVSQSATRNSEFVFQSHSYVDALHALLAGTRKEGARKPRGSIQSFAGYLKCHPSFIAQVLAGRANFSVDQGILAAEFFKLTPEAKEHLLDLVLWERAGAPSAKEFFSRRIETRRKERENLSKRWNIKQELSDAESWEFFSSWINQVIYSLVNIPRYQKLEPLQHVLSLDQKQLEKILDTLERLQLVERRGNTVKPKKNWLHLSKDSPAIRSHHQTWRLRAIDEFTRARELSGFHYSGAVTLTTADAETLRQELLAFMDRVRRLVANSESEKSFALNLDFFSLC